MSTELAKREIFSLTPTSLAEAMEFAKIIASSDLVPKDYKGQPGNVLVAVQMGAEVGLSPMQSLQSIAVINGRPSVWGDAGLALVESSGLLEDFQEMDLADIAREGYATCTAIRRGRPSPITRTYDIAMAKTAKLWEKRGKDGQDTPWVTAPARMLQMRARWFVLRDGFADVLKGLKSREESEDLALVQGEEVGPRVIDMPRRSSEAKESNGAPVEGSVSANGQDAASAENHGDQASAHNGPTSYAEQMAPDVPKCPTCKQRPMKYKPEGRWGPWWSCTGYPECKGSMKDEEWKKQKQAAASSRFGESDPSDRLFQ